MSNNQKVNKLADYIVETEDQGSNVHRQVVKVGGTSNTYTEDEPAPVLPKGEATALVREDTPGTNTSNDGDVVVQRGTNYGAAYVQIVNSSGAFVDSFGGSGGTSAVDDAAFTVGTDSGTPVMGVASSDTVDSGDVGVLAMDTSRRLLVSIEADNAGIGGGTQYDVDDAAGGTDTGTVGLAVRDDSLTTLTPADGDYVPLRVNSTGALHVTGGGGGTEYVEDDAAAANPTGSANILVRTDSPSGRTSADGDNVAQCGTDKGEALVKDTDAAALLTTIDSDTGNILTNLGNIYNGFQVEGGSVATTGLLIQGDDGTNRKNINVDATTGDVQVDVTNTVTVDGSGVTQPVSGTVTANLSATDNAVLDSIDSAVNGTLVVDGSGVTQPVSGTVTANLSATDNAVLDAIAASVAAIDSGQLADGHNVTIDNASIAITAASLPLPTGAASAANQSTIIGHVDGIEALLTTIDADTSSMNTDLGTVAGAVSGTEMQVDVVASLPAGTNAIGKLAANSGVDIGDVDVTSQPARDNTTDTISASLDTSAIMDDTTKLTPKYAVIDEASSGNNTVIAAVAGKNIRVLGYVLVAAGAVTVRFEDGANGTALTGQMTIAENGGVASGFCPVGWFQTSDNTLLNLELSGATSVDGHVVYVEV